MSKTCCYTKETAIVHPFTRGKKKINILSTNYLVFSQHMSIKNRSSGEKEVRTVSGFSSSRSLRTPRHSSCLVSLAQHSQRRSRHPPSWTSHPASLGHSSTQMHCASLLPPPLLPGGNVPSYTKGESSTCAGSAPCSQFQSPLVASRVGAAGCCRRRRGRAGGKALGPSWYTM